MIQRDHGKLCCRAERAIGLCAVTPHCLADPIGRYSFPDLIDVSGTIAMRNNPQICHPEAEGVLTLLDIAGVYARGRDPNADLASGRARIGHFANYQDIPRWSLLLVPSCSHL
jgi:hypothetical protein